MLSHTSTLDIITHDPSFRCNSCSGYELSDYERSLLGDAQLDDVSDLQAHLQFLSDAVNSNLQAAINHERLFHEVNSKMMYVAPYIRSIIQAASGPDIQYISSYPLAVNPCLIHDPLLCVFPQYGSVTGIACVSIPSPFVSLERSTTQATKPSEVEDDVDSGEESPMDAEEWLARGAISSSSFEDGQASVEPPLLDYSFLARLTSDISEAMTPLALVCIARSQDLYGAMASCLHQRWAWDITEPLMGIALDDSTSSVRLVFGWLLQSIDDSTCFTMHIVHGFYGAYDLSIATDAKNFALSVASACRRFAVVSEKARAYTSQLQENIAQRKLNAWRLDQIGLAAEIANDVSLEEKIDLWRLPSDIDNPQALFSRNGKCDVKTRGRRRRSHSSSSSPPTMDMDARPAKKIKKVKSEPCRMTITHSIQEDSVEFTLMQTPPPAVDGAVGVDFRSASSLAAGGNDPDKTRPMKYWLYNHLAVPRTLAFPAMLKKHLASDVEQRITQEYYSLTTFGWLDDKFDISDDLKALPLVKAAVAAVAQVKLLAQLGQSSQYVPLTGQSAEVLQSSLWEVVSALEDIQRLRVGMDQASELECRHHIDRLMLKFFQGHKDGSTTELSEADYVNTPHVMVSLERSLALPRGCVAHIVDDPESLEEARTAYNNALNRDSLDIVPLIRELSPSSVPANPTMVPDPATQSSLRASAMNRTTFQQDVVLVRKAADLALARYTPFSILNDQLTLESLREPERAVCDSVGYIRFPSIFTSITASSSFNMIQTSKSHTPSQKCRTTIAPTVSARSIREQAMGRPLEMNDSDDIFATAQNFSGMIKARQAIVTIVDVTVEGDNKHSLPGMTVQTGGHERENKVNIDLRQDFFFPILLAEHKKRLQIFFATSINQGRLYATASVRFYAAMDVYDVGVYTIVSEGSVLVVTVSYAEHPKLTTTSTLPPLVNILERNTVSFDLAEPLGLLNFVTFLIKLRIEYVPQVLKRVASVMGESSESIAEYLCSLEVPIGGPVNEAQWRHYRSKQ